jgi:uncharacterized membrane-anchored protein YitT (DUF2179 family)
MDNLESLLSSVISDEGLMKKIKDVTVYDIVDIINKKHLGMKIFLFVIGMLISAFAFNLFYAPYNVVPSGSSGLSLLVSEFIKIDISLIVLIINIILLLIGLIFFNYEYAVKMLTITILYPSFLKTTTLITKYIDFENTSLFLLMLIGGASMGLSSGLIRKSGFNPGGFSPLYDILKKYFHLSYGVSGFIVNAIIISASGYIYGIDNAIYAIISLIISSYIVDRVVIGVSDSKVFYIITNKPDELRDVIMKKLNYCL